MYRPHQHAWRVSSSLTVNSSLLSLLKSRYYSFLGILAVYIVITGMSSGLSIRLAYYLILHVIKSFATLCILTNGLFLYLSVLALFSTYGLLVLRFMSTPGRSTNHLSRNFGFFIALEVKRRILFSLLVLSGSVPFSLQVSAYGLSYP